MEQRSVRFGLITIISLVTVGLSMILTGQPGLAQNAGTQQATMAATCVCYPPDSALDMASLKLEPITVGNASRITRLARVQASKFDNLAWSPDGKTIAGGD